MALSTALREAAQVHPATIQRIQFCYPLDNLQHLVRAGILGTGQQKAFLCCHIRKTGHILFRFNGVAATVEPEYQRIGLSLFHIHGGQQCPAVVVILPVEVFLLQSDGRIVFLCFLVIVFNAAADHQPAGSFRAVLGVDKTFHIHAAVINGVQIAVEVM